MRDIIDRIVSKGLDKGLKEVEVYAIRNITRQLNISNEKISEGVVSEEYDIGIRGAVDRRVSSVRTNTLLIDIEKVISKLYSAILSSPEDPYWSGFPTVTGALNPVVCYDEKTASMSEDELVEILKFAMDTLKEPAIRKGVDKACVVEGSFTIRETELTIVNSHGLDRNMKCTNLVLWLALSIYKSGSQSDRFLVYARRKLNIKEIEKKALESGEQSLLFLNSSPIDSGKYDIILLPDVTGDILEYSLAPAFSALNILENRSPLRNKLNNVVFNEMVTIIDDPTFETALGTRSFDDEGVATKTKPLVENGVFKNILHSYYTAKRMNAEPTGNGLRPYPAAQPIPSFTNLLIKPGEGTYEEFMRDVGKAIVVYEVIGHWMSDPVTGGVKATISHGLLVEKGEIVKPIKGMVLGGNIYEWLSKNIVAVGRDIEIVGTTITPSIWIREVNVAGK